MMDELLKGLARRIAFCNCATEGPALKRCECESLYQHFVDAGLGELLEAGERMKVRLGTHRQYGAPEAIDWESSTNRVRAAVAAAEKGRAGE